MLSRGMKEAFQSFSADGGKTWQPQTTFFPHVNSKAVFRRLQSGNVLLIRHGIAVDRQAKNTTEEWNWGKGRSYLTAFLSTDDGETWSGELLLDERHPVSYPDITQTPNGDIYVHYDRDRNGAAELPQPRHREFHRVSARSDTASRVAHVLPVATEGDTHSVAKEVGKVLHRCEPSTLGNCLEGEVGAYQIGSDLRQPHVHDRRRGRLADSLPQEAVERASGDGKFRGNGGGGEPGTCLLANDP